MPTITLHTGTVTVTSSNPLDAASISGTGAVWDDGSTGTGATVFTSFDSGFSASSFTDWAKAPIDQLVLPSGATVNSITAYLTAKTTSNPSVTTPDPRVRVQLNDAAHSSSPFTTSFQQWAHTDVGTSDATYTQAIDPSFSTFLSVAGNVVMLFRIIPFGATSPYHHSVYASEFRIDVDYTGGTPTTTFAPPLRLTNRDDMFGSARRLTGSTSRQGSNRVTGYL
jgi:hypothetical protein